MFSHPNNNPFVTKIKFNLIDPVQLSRSSRFTSTDIRFKLLPLLQFITKNINSTPKRMYGDFKMTDQNEIFGAEVEIEILSKIDLSNENIHSRILTAINESLPPLNLHENLKIENNLIDVSSIINNTPNAKFRGRVASRIHTHDHIGDSKSVAIEFLDESINVYSHNKSPIQKREYDKLTEITRITYEYQQHEKPNNADVFLLNYDAKAYVDEHPDNIDILKSIESGDYNEAFSQACSVGNSTLASLITKHDFNNQLNLNMHQPCFNGLTPLDLAIKSGNKTIIEFLTKHGAKKSDELICAFTHSKVSSGPEWNITYNETVYNAFQSVSKTPRANSEPTQVALAPMTLTSNSLFSTTRDNGSFKSSDVDSRSVAHPRSK